MAIFHLDVSTVKRSEGRSAVAAAAYRAGQRLYDGRIGQTFNYTRRTGVASSFVALPTAAPEWSRNDLWNQAEAAEKRKNATVAREWLVALPAELNSEQREELTRALAAELVVRFSVAVDVAIHEPGRTGDERNHHAHLLTSTRELTPEGFGAKTRVLDAAKTGGVEIKKLRAWWADTCNEALEAAGVAERIDPRRKAVQAAEAAAFAQEAEEEAERLEMIAAPVSSLSDFKAGIKAVMAEPGALMVRKPAKAAEERRQEAARHRDKAKAMDSPPERHRGPQNAALARKKAEIERRERERLEVLQREREARRRAEEAKRARERDVERQRELALQREQARQAERERQIKEEKRLQAVEEFRTSQMERVDKEFPTPARGWRWQQFVPFQPDSIRMAFRSNHQAQLKEDEVTDLQKSMLRRWVERIVEDLHALKPTVQSVWIALVGSKAANTLKEGYETYPEICEPLRLTIKEHEAQKTPKPKQSNPGPSSGPGLGM